MVQLKVLMHMAAKGAIDRMIVDWSADSAYMGYTACMQSNNRKEQVMYILEPHEWRTLKQYLICLINSRNRGQIKPSDALAVCLLQSWSNQWVIPRSHLVAKFFNSQLRAISFDLAGLAVTPELKRRSTRHKIKDPNWGQLGPWPA